DVRQVARAAPEAGVEGRRQRRALLAGAVGPAGGVCVEAVTGSRPPASPSAAVVRLVPRYSAPSSDSADNMSRKSGFNTLLHERPCAASHSTDSSVGLTAG